MRMHRFVTVLVSLAVSLPLGAVTALAGAAPAGAATVTAAGPSANRMPGDVPSRKTPWVLDGQVFKIVQVGDLMVAGGAFTQVADPMNGTPYSRQNLFAFDAATGQVSQTFNPTLDGAVQQLLPGPTADTVYVAGDFTKVNGKGPNHLQLLDVRTGQAVTSFRAPSTAGGVSSLEMLPGNRLMVGGYFRKVAGLDSGQLITLNATTGARDSFLNLTFVGNHNTGTGAKAPVGPRETALTPDGRRLAVVGNFRTVDGIARDQIVMIDLTGPTAQVVPDWYTTRYTPICSPRAFDSYMRDVEMSPDGSYFVVSTTGGPVSGTLCDTASRWETWASGTTLQPTWSSVSGGDTLWGVEVTRAAVFVGGHQRWMNNPNGSDRAAQGAVPRAGLAALDPLTGIPLKWNPGRHPRGEAAYEVHETDGGIWVVSDTEYIADRRYQRARIAYFPYSEGYDTASTTAGTLPGNVYIGGPQSTTANARRASVLAFDGATVTSQATVSTDTFDWTNVRGSVMVGRTLFYGQTDGYLYSRSFDGTAFGPPARVNPYLDPLWSSVETGSGTTGQTYAGVLPTWYGQLSSLTGTFYADGRIYYTRSGQNALYWRWFSPDSGIIGGVENTVTGGNIAWSSARGMFVDGATLYVVNGTTGQLLRIPFVNGAPSGTSSVANASIDWRGRALFLASVLPNTAPTAAFTSACAGTTCTFDAGGSSDGDGTVSSYEWTFSDGDQAGGPAPEKDFVESGTYDVTLTVTDDGGLTHSTTQQVTVVKPNVPPTAAFSLACDFLACELNAGDSSDGDGVLTAYAWDFGDGGTASGAATDHTFAAPGTYTVSLEVTDDDGATDTTSTVQVVVAAPSSSTVSYVGGAATQGNASSPNVTLPATVSAGDRLVMALSLNASNRVVGAPTGTSGWTVLGTTTSGSMQTVVYSKVAAAGDAGRRTTVTLDAAAKYTMTVGAWSGVRTGALVSAHLAETVVRAGHTTPVVEAPPGSWVVAYWADKTSATTGFTLPGDVTSRQAVCSTGTGRVCSVMADSGAAVPAGAYGGLLATADATSGSATMSSVVLRTVEPNQAPTAAFTHDCTSTACTFDAAASNDADGSVTGWAWDFGDGGTATGRTVDHDFLTSGTREVTLTVTDDEGTTGSVVVPVEVTRTNAAPVAAFTVTCRYLVCSYDAGASSDADGTVTSYEWDFGDGTGDSTASATTTHVYDAAGTRTARLVVTDGDGGTGETTRDVSPVAIRQIALAGSTATQGNASTPSTLVPAATSAGDRMVLVLSVNDATRATGDPTSGVTGWTLLGSRSSGSMRTLVWTRTAAAGDAGRPVRFSMEAALKYTLTLASYSGDMLAPQVASAGETVVRAAHTTPTVEAGAGDWAVSYWADKSSATTGFTLPAGTTGRQAICGTSSGRVCSVLADSGGPVDQGPYGGLTATADAASGSATAWTILLRLDR